MFFVQVLTCSLLTVSVQSLLKPGGLCTVSVYLPTERPSVDGQSTNFRQQLRTTFWEVLELQFDDKEAQAIDQRVML